MKRSLAAAVVALLALPAAASAHPGVYSVTQSVRPANATCTIPDTSCLTTRTQYAVGNDGWANSFTEDNTLPPGANRGMINYKAMPSGWRGTEPRDPPHLRARPDEPAGPRRCTGVAALETGPNILAWQEDPFFNYIPWQATTANVGDEPSEWIPLVQQLTGVDCGAYRPRSSRPSASGSAGPTTRPTPPRASRPRWRRRSRPRSRAR